MAVVSVSTSISPNVALSSVQIVGTNTSRKFFILYNNSSNSCYVNFGIPATGNGCSIIIGAFTYWAWPAGASNYIGTISAIRNAGTGTITVTEFNYQYAL